MLTIKQITDNTEGVIRGLEKKHFKDAKATIEQVLALAATNHAGFEAKLVRGDTKNSVTRRTAGTRQDLVPDRHTQSSRTSATRSATQGA